MIKYKTIKLEKILKDIEKNINQMLKELIIINKKLINN